jgi:UDP:flavonoid glycosyltransferase YjiC (YdhE family)
MKFLLVPENNSLSHVAKCLAIQDHLLTRGHDSLIAVSSKSARFVRGLGRECAVLPDIQENDDAGFPTVNWFNRADKIAECIKAEVALIGQYRPDRVLGVFRFTMRASAELAGVPFDSLSCGCMLHTTPEVLGFDPEHPGAAEQKLYLDMFYRYAAAKVTPVMESFGLEGIGDIREMLHGERTFLWDFPEFCPVTDDATLHHVGPLSWRGWQHDEIELEAVLGHARPLAVVSFGTCVHSVDVAERTVRLLLGLGYQVLVAAGGQAQLAEAIADHPRVTVCHFAPLHLLFPYTSLLVCHGGQMTLFEAMSHRVPVLVMPLQPEQAHNGVCLERLGCGRMLLPPQQFRGSSSVYIDAFKALDDDAFCRLAGECVQQAEALGHVAAARQLVRRFDALDTLCGHLVS